MSERPSAVTLRPIDIQEIGILRERPNSLDLICRHAAATREGDREKLAAGPATALTVRMLSGD